MHPALSSALRSPRFAPLPESAAAALRLLADSSNTAWLDLATVASKDAAFTHAVLAAAPLAKKEQDQELPTLLALRLERMGADLLRAWLLHIDAPTPQNGLQERILTHSLLTAECALHLAIETDYPRPQEAYLAGLWHDLGRLWLLAAATDYAEFTSGFATETLLATEERKRYGLDHASLASRLAAEGGAPLHLVDAIALHHALEEQAGAAHPLARIVWAAEALASDEHDTLLTSISRVTGLGETALLSLRTDLAYLTNDSLRDLGIGQTLGGSTGGLAGSAGPPVLAAGAAPGGLTVPPPNDYWRSIALQGLLRGSFTGVSAELAGRRLELSCRLLFGRPLPFIVSVTPSGQLGAAPVPGQEETGQCFDELELHLDDEASVVALAARTGATTSHFPGPQSPGRSPRDWHLARWLGAPGLLCLPCRSGDDTYVAVFGIDEHLESAAPEQSLMAILAASAASVILEKSRRSAAESALRSGIEQRYREHARRVVHEANNPLTVIRSYLDMIGRRLDADEALQGDLGLLNKELDRIGTLLCSVSHGPASGPEAPHSNVSDLLLELRAMYGEALFARRNIEFNLRTGTDLPAAHIPPSVLKQVLINLLRNASEALAEGGKLTLSTPGTLIADGVPCQEIRLIDNGPGIPPERLANLFEPKPSPKPGHQGVGLSICRELLSNWKATIVCRSQAGFGTSFQIFIPLDKRT